MSKNQVQSDANIEQIRSLIFGQQMHDYESRFVEINENIAGLRKEMTAAFKELKSSIEALDEKHLKQQAKLSHHLDETQKSLQQQLADAEARVRQMIEQVDNDAAGREVLAGFFLEMSHRLRDGSMAEMIAESNEAATNG